MVKMLKMFRILEEGFRNYLFGLFFFRFREIGFV